MPRLRLSSPIRKRRLTAAGVASLLCLATIWVCPACAVAQGSVTASPPADVAQLPQGRATRADFRGELASGNAREVADWVVDSSDNRGLPFAIIDKVNAKVFVFGNSGVLRGAARALLGLARGDDTTPGIGHRRLAAIRPSERTTPAGRFVAALGRDFEQDILWIDYDTSLSLHRVIKGAPKDHRALRLSTASSLDKRISYGCINVPATFYDSIVARTFAGTTGIVYILPEVKPLREVFAMASPSARPPQGLPDLTNPAR